MTEPRDARLDRRGRRHGAARRRDRGDRVERLPGDALERRAGEGGQPAPTPPGSRRPARRSSRTPRREIDVATFIQWVDAYAQERDVPGRLLLQAVPGGVQARRRCLDRDDARCENPNGPADAVRDAGVPPRGTARKRSGSRRRPEISRPDVRRNIQRSTNYMLGVVLFAVALFFAGMSTKLAARGPRLVVLILGCLVFLATLDVDRDLPDQRLGLARALSAAVTRASRARGRVPVARVALGVDRLPGGLRLDPVANAHAARRPPRARRRRRPALTPPRSAAPYAAPSSATVRSSGSPRTEATILSQSSLRAPPPETRGRPPPRRRRRGAARASRAGRTRRPRAPRGRARRGRAGARGRRRRRARPDRHAASARPGGTAGRGDPRRPGSQPSASREQLVVGRAAERARGATAASRRPRASRPSRATSPGRRGRRCAAGPRAPAGTRRRGEDDAGGAEDDRERARARRSPTPSAPAAWSPAPAISVDSYAGGSHSRGSSSASSTSSLQRRLATSKRSVPEASATSIARSPVSRKRT